MTKVIPTERGGVCGICLGDFKPKTEKGKFWRIFLAVFNCKGEEQVTHVGGEGHDGFHKSCLKEWVVWNPTCPFDNQPIDPNSLISRTERIRGRIKPALANAAYAACFGLAATGIAGVAVAGGAAVAGAIAGAAAGAGAVAGAAAGVGAVEGALGAGAVGLGTVLAAGAIGKEAVAGAAGAIGAAAVVGAGVAGIVAAVAKEAGVVAVTVAVTAAETVTAGVAGAAVVAGAMGIDWILNRREINQIARENITGGMCVGGITTMLASGASTIPFLTAIKVNSLVGGVAAGIFSLIRR
jgi:hypothetical protein